MISQTKSSRIRWESNPQNWRTKGTHFWESQKEQNSHARTALDKILFRIWYLCSEFNQHSSFSGFGIVKAIQDPIGQPPAYKIGLAVRSDARFWREMLEIARDQTMFGTRLANTAALYAEVVWNGLTQFEEDSLASARTDKLASWKPVHFEQATAEFQQEFRECLRNKIAQERQKDEVEKK